MAISHWGAAGVERQRLHMLKGPFQTAVFPPCPGRTGGPICFWNGHGVWPISFFLDVTSPFVKRPAVRSDPMQMLGAETGRDGRVSDALLAQCGCVLNPPPPKMSGFFWFPFKLTPKRVALFKERHTHETSHPLCRETFCTDQLKVRGVD